MPMKKLRKDRRWGAAAVETALVMIPLTMFLFGILEFGRLVMNWSILNNAAREGCRFALAHNTDTNISTEVQNTVTTYMANQNANFTNFTVTVSSNPTGTNVNSLAPGNLIQVQATGKFNFMNIIPLIHMPSTTLSSTVVMVCEGGT